ncbi:hypothetical protein [Flavobacterium xueshanense]|uniref:Uncharacterized protein n=1 Tax=Flavobacterium xueshanense TaxID=935223 RepID=A0A1I2CFH4_9FLAO|nr:hypothetical protein [Flavobacterium xueshanense]SFE67046.1 hypothetical protein SAMN04488131_10358 [Flavobacterium xueshanense]
MLEGIINFGKNVLTGGGYGKLEDEKKEFETLKKKYAHISSSFSDLYKNRLEAYTNLEDERLEAHRNFAIAKSLLKKFKNVANNQNLKTNDNLTAIEIKNYQQEKFNYEVSFNRNLEAITNTLSGSVEKSFKRHKGKNIKDISKDEFLLEAGVVAIETIFEGFSQAINYNGEIQKQRKQIQREKQRVINIINKLFSDAEIVYSETQRIIEVGKVLNINNQVFTSKYSEINNFVTSQSIFKQFWNEIASKKITPTADVNLKIAQLMNICAGYNKTDKGTSI